MSGGKAAAPFLVCKPVSHIVTFWRPGSHDWSWRDEYADLIGDPVTARVLKRVDSEGIDFADGYAPVLLGSDGRVWDGHHRICIAIQRCIPSLMVEVADADNPTRCRCHCGTYPVDPDHCLTLFDRDDTIVERHEVGACEGGAR